MQKPLAKIVGVGARSGLGLNSLQIALGLRAERFEPHSLSQTDQRGFRLGAFFTPSVSQQVQGKERLLALGGPALAEVSAGQDGPLPIIVAVPEPGREDLRDESFDGFVNTLAKSAGVAVDLANSKLVHGDNAAFVRSIRYAVECLSSGKAHRIIVGGIDSHSHPELLRVWDEQRRLSAEHTEGGIVPSEGAAFVMLARGNEKEPRETVNGKHSRVELCALDIALQPAPADDGSVDPAEAMTGLVRRLAAASGGRPIDWIITDVNEERARHREWTMVQFRLKKEIPDTHRYDRFVADMGELGAATGAMFLAIAYQWWNVGCRAQANALLALHSDEVERGGLLVNGVPKQRFTLASAKPRLGPKANGCAARIRSVLEGLYGTLLRVQASTDRKRLGEAAAATFRTLAHWSDLARSGPAGLEALDEVARAVNTLRRQVETSQIEALKSDSRQLQQAEQQLMAYRDQMLTDVQEFDQDKSGDGRQAGRENPFFASMGEPFCNCIERPIVAPLLLEQRSLQNTAGQTLGGERVFESEQVRKLARSAMEDIAAFGNLRKPDGDRNWTAAADFEQRLLDNLDSLASLCMRDVAIEEGPDILAALLRYSTELTMDKGRAFARAFVLGSVAGSDTVSTALLYLCQSHRATYDVQRSALCVGSNPEIDEAMRRLFDHRDPALIALALDVLAFRRAVPVARVIELLNHPDPAVAVAATRALAVADSNVASEHALAELLRADVSDRVRLAAAEALMLLGQSTGLDFLRQVLAEEQRIGGTFAADLVQQALELVALGGGINDTGRLQYFAQQQLGDVGFLGWFGDAEQVPLLIASLETKDTPELEFESEQNDVALALQRITGAGLFVEDGELQLPYLTIDPERWKSWWLENQQRFATRQKYRFGKPFSPQACYEELSDEQTLAQQRRLCAHELRIATGLGKELEIGDFVTRQRTALQSIARQLPSADRYPPGRWPG